MLYGSLVVDPSLEKMSEIKGTMNVNLLVPQKELDITPHYITSRLTCNVITELPPVFLTNWSNSPNDEPIFHHLATEKVKSASPLIIISTKPILIIMHFFSTSFSTQITNRCYSESICKRQKIGSIHKISGWEKQRKLWRKSQLEDMCSSLESERHGKRVPDFSVENRKNSLKFHFRPNLTGILI